MADNTTLSATTGGDLIASDELTTINGGVAAVGLKAQRVKVGHGVDGDFKDATSANPLPVAIITSVALTDAQLRATAVPVSGAFFQTTQPVNGTVAVSNMVAQGLTDTQIRAAALPVSIAATVNVSTGLVQAATDAQMRATALPVVVPELRATTLWVTATGAAGAAVTLTLPAPAAGLFHCITAIDIMLYAAAARTGSATPIVVTTTNLPGSPAWVFMTAQVIGAMDNYDVPLLTPLKSSVAATATTVAAPIATGGLWRLNVGYYTSV